VTAVFTLADPMLFRPLPYPEPDRIHRASVRGEGTFGGFATYEDYFRAKTATSFASVGDFDGPLSGRVTDDPSARSMMGYAVADGYLDVLGARPARGRLFTREEYDGAPDRLSRNEIYTGVRPALITTGMWRSVFGGREDVLGQVVSLKWVGLSQPLQVVGVLGPDFVFPDLLNAAPDFLVPGRIDRSQAANPRAVAGMLVRLRPGVDAAAAEAELRAILAAVERDHAKVPQGRTVRLLPVRDTLFSRVRTPMTLLLVITLSVFVLAAGNLAHLSFARAAERAREVAVRRALGATSLQIVRLLLAESLILGAVGAAAALAVGQTLFALVTSVLPRFGHVYRLMPARLDGRVVAAGLVITALALVVAGLLPALAAARQEINRPLQEATPRAQRGRRWSDRALVGLQAALAVSILATATLLIGSFVRLLNTVQGIDMDGLTSVGVELPVDYFRPINRTHEFSRDFVSRVTTATGQSLAVSRGLPGVTLPGAVRRSGDDPASKVTVVAYPADRMFLDAVRLQPMRGRLFSQEEATSDAPVAVIDERAVAFFWPGEDGLGKVVIDFQGPVPRDRVVIGIVRAVNLSFRGEEGTGRAFVPLDPLGRSTDGYYWRGEVTPRMAAAVREAAIALEPRALVGLAPLQPFERSLGEPRLLARLLGTLALLALVVTVAGIYAVVSHTVARRTGEIGVRVALGATGRDIGRLIVGESVRPALAGAVLGLVACAWWLGSLRALLFGFEPADPRVLAFAALVVVLTAVLASAIPARRASRVDPAATLRGA